MTLAYPPQTHVMVPPSLRDRLKALSQATRVPQSKYYREAAEHVLFTYNRSSQEPFPPKEKPGAGFVSLVFRLGDPVAHEGLRALSERTRVGVGEYMRVGLEYVVTKYEEARDAA